MKITKEQFNALSSEQQKLWKVVGEEYELVGDTEIAAEARRAKDREKARADDLQTQLTAVQTKLTEIEGASVRKSGDIDAIEKSWDAKVKAAEKKGADTEKKLKDQIQKLVVENEVAKLAAEIFTKPNRDARLIKDRVTVDYDGDEPKLRILDKDGKASALTLADLRKEIVDNPEYEDILIGSKGGGSGGASGGNGGGATKQPKDYTEQERVALFRTDPKKFKELFPTA